MREEKFHGISAVRGRDVWWIYAGGKGPIITGGIVREPQVYDRWWGEDASCTISLLLPQSRRSAGACVAEVNVL